VNVGDQGFSFPFEIDLATVAAFQAGLFRNVDATDTPIVYIDLAAVTFMGSAGYHALVNANEYAVARGHTLMVRNLDEFYADVLRFCDQDNELLVERAP
jgi:anti-anti-sigma factor